MTAIALTESAVIEVKRTLRDCFPSIKSSHLTEALAAACGFKTNAALIAAVKSGVETDPDFVLLDDASFYERLRSISAEAASEKRTKFSFNEITPKPTLNILNTHSSKSHKLIRLLKSKRSVAWRNMMVAAINAGIDQRLFSIRPGDNRWPIPELDMNGRSGPHVYQFTIFGIPALASVGNAGYDELSIHVAFWPTSDGHRWVQAANADFLAGDAFATGWIERREGAWLQIPSRPGGRSNFACRRTKLDDVFNIEIKSKGYSDHGNFKL